MVFMVLFQQHRVYRRPGEPDAWSGSARAASWTLSTDHYWAKMFVLCFYTIWVVLPFKILVLTSALASVNQDYYKAARVDGTSRRRIFFRITLPMISPMIVYLVITRIYRRLQGLQRCGCPFWHQPERSGDEHHCGVCLRHALRRQRRLSVLCFRSGHPPVCHRA